MDAQPAHGLELGGPFDDLPRGQLRVSNPRELLVCRTINCAYEMDGSLAEDTVRLYSKALLRTNQVPASVPDQEVVEVHEEEVVWGGGILPHYGHFLLESTSRLWPLLSGGPLEERPTVFTNPHRTMAAHAREWFDAFGVPAVELPERGVVRLMRAFVPEQAWRIGSWAAPEIRDVHLNARRGLDVPSPLPQNDVLWLSRSRMDLDRVPYDEGLLEWILRDHVTSVSPETYSLSEQVALLEGCRAVAGVAGSAFHTLLMVANPPECLYAFPSFDKSPFAVQHRFLDVRADFVSLLSPTARIRQLRPFGGIFPGGYRLLIPETLRALNATVIPGLLDDPGVAAFADPANRSRSGHATSELESVVLKVLAAPFAIESRIRLAELFEERGHPRCALEQFVMASILDPDGTALRRAARLMQQLNATGDRSAIAALVLTAESA